MLFQSLKVDEESSQAGDIVQKIILITALILLVAGGSYIYFIAPNREVAIDIKLPEEEVNVGDIFDLEVEVTNDSQGVIGNTRLSLNLPPGLRLLDAPDRVNEVRDLNEVARRQSVAEVYKLIALPVEDKSDYQLEAQVNYAKSSLSADFVNEDSKRVKVEDANFNLQLDIPETIFTNKVFDMKAIYDYTDVKEGPGRFLVIEGDNLEVLPSERSVEGESSKFALQEGESQSIEASILINRKEKDVQTITGKIVMEFNGQDYVIEEKQKEVLLAPSPLTFNVSLSDPKEFASLGETLEYNVSYANNTDFDLENVSIELELVGDMFDFESIGTDGEFNDLTKTTAWNFSKFDELNNVRKGERGNFNLRINVKDEFPSYTLSDKNFTLKANASIESPTVTQGEGTGGTKVEKSLEVKISGSLSIDAQAFFRDAQAKVVNEGPIPPQVGRKTQFTIHWVMSGLGTDLKDVRVKAALPSHVTVDSLIGANVGELSTIQEDNAEQLVWSIDEVSTTDFLQGESPEAVIQVSLMPTNGMVGGYASLLGLTTISAIDAFTGVELLDTDHPLTTNLTDDSTVSADAGKVVIYNLF